VHDLAHFDAAQAKCFLMRNRQRLLAVIEASFGTVAPFNKTVRGILAYSIGRRRADCRGIVPRAMSQT
jgi:hypothetical protein